MSQDVQVPNISEGAVSGLDHEPLTRREPSHLRGSTTREETAAEPSSGEELKGDALDEAVRAANEDGADIKVSGTADERRAALAEYEANGPAAADDEVEEGDED